MAFLPKKLGSAKEQSRAHFPTHHIGPLIDQQRQITIALDPALKGVADDRFRRRPDDQRLLEFRIRVEHQLTALILQAVMRDDRHFLGEALDVLCLLGDEAHGNKQREVAVLVTRILDALIEFGLNPLPNAPAPGLDDHAAANGALLGHVAVANRLLIPFRKILLTSDREGALAHRAPPMSRSARGANNIDAAIDMGRMGGLINENIWHGRSENCLPVGRSVRRH